jgi:Serine incorporator (Serinc)
MCITSMCAVECIHNKNTAVLELIASHTFVATATTTTTTTTTVCFTVADEQRRLVTPLYCTVFHLYTTATAYIQVGKNPNAECNPFVGSSQNNTSIAIGLVLTILSLMWICADASTSVTKLLGGDTPPTTVSVQRLLNSYCNDVPCLAFCSLVCTLL